MTDACCYYLDIKLYYITSLSPFSGVHDTLGGINLILQDSHPVRGSSTDLAAGTVKLHIAQTSEPRHLGFGFSRDACLIV